MVLEVWNTYWLSGSISEHFVSFTTHDEHTRWGTTLVNPILEMWKLRHFESKFTCQDRIAERLQGWDSNPD